MTGEELWQSSLHSVNSVYNSSPILAGDKLYIFSDEEVFFLCELSPAGLQISSQTKFEDYVAATPVLNRDRILLRGTKNLYFIGK
jgi:hypothetical protein